MADLTLGVGIPLLGFLAAKAGVEAVFNASAVAAVLAIPVTLHVMRRGLNRASVHDGNPAVARAERERGGRSLFGTPTNSGHSE
jgi:hypothetical protein